MKAKYYILISLIGLIAASVLFAGYLLEIKETQTLRELEEEASLPKEAPEEKLAQKVEIQSIINKINLIMDDFAGLNDSIDELDEDEDLSKIFQGD